MPVDRSRELEEEVRLSGRSYTSPIKWITNRDGCVMFVLKKDTPTLLSMKYEIGDGLDISVQGRYASLRPGLHPLSMEDYFLIHRWEPVDTDFAFNTETELRTIHR